jgi:hypothetical protein
MNIQQLQNELDRLGVSRRLYSLRGWSDEKLCLENRQGQWHVYFVERGQERPMKVFESEEQACEFMLSELKYEV